MSEQMRPQLEHPSVFIREELEARGWSEHDLAARIAKADEEPIYAHVALGVYLEAGPTHPGMRMGQDMAIGLGKAFGTSPDLWLALERSWRESLTTPTERRTG